MKEIILSDGSVATVDDDDFDRYDELARQYCGEFARCNFPEAA